MSATNILSEKLDNVKISQNEMTFKSNFHVNVTNSQMKNNEQNKRPESESDLSELNKSDAVAASNLPRSSRTRQKPTLNKSNSQAEPLDSRFYQHNKYQHDHSYRRFSTTNTKAPALQHKRFTQPEKEIKITKNEPKKNEFRRKSVHDVALEASKIESKRVILEMLADQAGGDDEEN